MGSGSVVVLGVRADHWVQVSSSPDERPVRHSDRIVRTHGSVDAFARGVRNGVRTISKLRDRERSAQRFSQPGAGARKKFDPMLSYTRAAGFAARTGEPVP